jgi:hypothetical protein
MSDDEPLELRLARAAYAEAEKLKKSAEQDRAAAEYVQGQAERSLREIQMLEKSLAAREQHLRELGEAELIAREQAAEAKLAEAKALLAEYHNDRHAAARALIAINEREKAAREQAAAA